MKNDEIKNLIKSILEKMDVPYDSIEDASKDEELRFNVKTKRSGILIGSRGEHISALNHVVKKIASKGDPKPVPPGGPDKDEGVRVTVDVNGYLEENDRNLRNKVFILAERARSFKMDVELPPMTPYERMVIHAFLSADPHLETKSIGEGKKRRIVIKYREDKGTEE